MLLKQQLYRSNMQMLINSQRSISILNKKGGAISRRIGHDYRTMFGFVVIVPENYALLIHRFKKYHG